MNLLQNGVPGNKLRTISYGSDHQTQAGEGQDAFAFNRRVDIVIMSQAKDSVRALLPDAAKALEQGGGAGPARIGPGMTG